MINDLAQISAGYISLCFELEKYLPGLVDGYSGPTSLRAAVEAADRKPVTELLSEAEKLQEQLTRVQDDVRRIAFLAVQLRSLHTLARIANGEDLQYLEEVALIYDIHPRKEPETIYKAALSKLNHLLPGSDPLFERIERYRKTLEIPNHLVLEVFSEALAEVRKRTKSFIQLPESETVELVLVSQKPWSGYNWFLGSAQSRVEVNIDLPRRVDHVLHLMAHEGYPGHHTDASMKEQELYKNRGYLEFSIHPLFSAQSVIAEGIAEMAKEVIFSREEESAYLRERIAPKLERACIDLALMREIAEAVGDLRSVAGNASILLLAEERGEKVVCDYLREYGLLDVAFARKRVEFIQKYRGYIFTYHYGYDLLKRYLKGKDLRSSFRQLMLTAHCPSELEGGRR